MVNSLGPEAKPVTIPQSTREMASRQFFTVPELVRLTGASRKQITYWAKIGLLIPTMRNAEALTGQPASFYSTREVIKGLIICELRRVGFSPRQVQQIIRNLEENNIRLDQTENYLLTDGYSVYYAHSDNEVVDILKHHRQMLLLVPIHEHVARLRGAA